VDIASVSGVATVHPRSSWVDPRYPVTGPATNWGRIDTAVIHYTAADNLIDGDPGEHASNLPAYIRSIQKSYETNRGYSIGYWWAVDWLGGVWQLRGWDIKSAANATHNEHTAPILVLVDGADAATDEATKSIRALVAETSRIAGRPIAITGHGWLTGAQTECPGAGLRSQIAAGDFVPRPPEPEPEPTPEPIEDDDMMIAIYRPAWFNHNDETRALPWLCASGGSVRPATSHDTQWAAANGVPTVDVTDANQYNNLVRAAGLPLPISII
jgi:hypothetical protein